MSSLNTEDAVAGAHHNTALAETVPEKHEREGSDLTDDDDFPTEEEMKTLRRIPDKIPWKAFPIAFVELCERFSYYGTTVVCEWLFGINYDTNLFYYFVRSEAYWSCFFFSHEFPPTTASSWVEDWCWPQWTVWRSQPWSTGLYWSGYL